MIELAAVIAEHKLDNNAEGWFKIPWRDGWNAVGLAVAASPLDYSRPWLTGVFDARRNDMTTYWEAEERMVGADPMLRAGLRCLQIKISNSHGGGHVYNAILVGPFNEPAPQEVSDTVLEHRCRDAIGTTAIMQNDVNDRLRRAFTTAWKRGLYLAAYSLPMAAIINHIKVVK